MNEDLAQNLWIMGGAHSLGAEAVVRQAKDWAFEIQAEDPEKAVFNGKYSASIYLLLGYGFELLLKAAFVYQGGDPKRLALGAWAMTLEQRSGRLKNTGLVRSAQSS